MAGTPEELERILLGWDYLGTEMVTAPYLTQSQFDRLVREFGPKMVLAGLRKYQQSCMRMAYDKTMSKPDQQRYGREVEKLQKRIDTLKHFV